MNSLSTPPVPILFDCDPGVDDAMALLWGLAANHIEIVAIGTVWGNVSVDLTTENALRLLEIGNAPGVPVAAGARKPLLGPEPAFSADIHGEDGQGGTFLPPAVQRPSEESAAEQIIRLAHERPGELSLVAVGPLTNLAVALMADPSIASAYKQVVVMGGAFQVPGNVTATGEANIWHDPEAAQIVFEAGWPLTIVGLDVTEQARVTETMLNELRDLGSPSGAHLQRISDGYLNIYAGRYGTSERQCPMHDALALGIAADPSLVRHAPSAKVDVELTGTLTRGSTIADLRSWASPNLANASVVLEADGERFVREWLATMRRLTA
ncbi:MAG: nucleoside hydrolase [Thermomicrobiales bacterium]